MVATRDTKPGHDTTTKPERRWLAATWLCAGLAALAKGPMALLIPLFLLLDTLLKPRRDNDPPRLVRLARLGWGWGVPLMLALPLAWLAAAWQVDAAHVRDELLGAQLAPRLEKTTVGFDPAEAVRGLWRVPGFAVERFAPWSILAVVGIIAMGQHWRSSPLRPALVWAAGVFAIALLDGGRSGSTIAPAYPALALLAVYGLARLIAGNDGRRAGSAALAAAAIVLVAALAVGAREAFLSRGARSDLGQQLKAFARQAERIVGDDHVVYLGTWHNPIPTLMGRARIGQPSAELFRQADWVVMTVDDRYPRVAESPDLVRLHGDFDGPRGEPERLGLYKREDLPESVLQDHDDPRW